MADRPLQLWLVNQYALRLEQPGITRHATLAKLMQSRGVRTTIFASDTHYWNVAGETTPTTDDSTVFFYTSTSAVHTNGVRRVVSMVGFALRTFLRAARPRAVGRPRPDVVLGSSPHPFAALAAWALALRYRVPFVLEVRDLWPDSLVHLLGMSRRHPLIVGLRVIERFLYRRARLVVTLLPGSEEHIRRVAGRPVATLWIPNGIDMSRVPPASPAPMNVPFTVMYAGAHGVPNSLETIIDAARLLEKGDVPVSVVFVGDGKEKPSLRERAAGLGNVEFRDVIPKSQLLELLPTADALVIAFRRTTLYESGISPNKVFDYLAAARPVIIAVDTPRNPVVAAGAGLTITPEDPVALAEAVLTVAAMAQPERTAMGRRGHEYAAAHHDLATLADHLADGLRRLTP